MRGVLLSHTDARLVDISHDFPRQDIRAGAFWLREILPYFPPAIHLVVIDPGVGTSRKALAVRVGEHALVGPDNGVLVPAARRLAGNEKIEAFEIRYNNTDSSTFHGRDVFAPAAAAVHERGIEHIEDFDRFSPTNDIETIEFPEAVVETGQAEGEVLVVDDFGNAITNIPGSVLEDRFGDTVTINGESVPVAQSYAHVDIDGRLVTVGSHGNVELAVNQGRDEAAFRVSVGSSVELSY